MSREGVRLLTLAFGPHRVEALPLLEKELRAHKIAVLEEPPHPDFAHMLRGEIGLRTYLRRGNFGFPRFALRACRLYQKLFRTVGTSFYQVEPYLEIVGRLSEGKSPATELEHKVWKCEHEATGALLAYYQSVAEGNFTSVVEAVKDFARADALRLRLRAELRAEAIKALLDRTEGSVCVEAGYIHLLLIKLLRDRIKPRVKLQVLYLLRDPMRTFGLRWRQHLGPGDVLTLRYVFGLRPSLFDSLLAARSLVYVALLPKEELLPSQEDPYPHLRRELELQRLVKRLSYRECAAWYYRLAKRPPF
ncbi:hypothetical protein [Ammonifex thiophilus]|uniref:Uncharacterized protein n=1 Tax=Ammonifex thiophilus TaxID=444093 RepID=A0A3D8P3Q4_9THEO|nr:hypothetical protein [Ammonifex thiophilus]RDV83435.1 hypothetical protein DXX99_05460 [Ammonifex thiophilus]